MGHDELILVLAVFVGLIGLAQLTAPTDNDNGQTGAITLGATFLVIAILLVVGYFILKYATARSLRLRATPLHPLMSG